MGRDGALAGPVTQVSDFFRHDPGQWPGLLDFCADVIGMQDCLLFAGEIGCSNDGLLDLGPGKALGDAGQCQNIEIERLAFKVLKNRGSGRSTGT